MQHAPAGLTPLARRCIAAGALLMLLGVILGAFGAHALQSLLSPPRLASYQTGVSYHLLHSGLLIASKEIVNNCRTTLGVQANL